MTMSASGIVIYFMARRNDLLP